MQPDEETLGGAVGIGARLFCPWQKWSPENIEARGFAYLGGGKGAIGIYGSLFASVAINSFALSVSDCEGRILDGAIKASSILASLGTIEGVCNAIAAPLVGTFADVTNYRRTVIGIGYGVVLALVALQIGLFTSTESDLLDPNDDDGEAFLRAPLWQTDAALLILVISVVTQVIMFEMANMLVLSYAPELSSDDTKMTEYVGNHYGLTNGMELTCAILLTGIGLAFGFDSLQLGMVGGIVTILIAVAWLWPGFAKLEPRKAAIENSGCCSGLWQLWRTLVSIWREYPQVFRFLTSWIFGSAAAFAMIILATSYLQFYIGLDGITTSAVLVVALIMSVPGALLTGRLAARFTLRNVYVASNTALGLSFVLAPFVLQAETVDLNPSEANDTIKLTQYGLCDSVEADFDDFTQTKQEASTFTFILVLCFTIFWGFNLGFLFVSQMSLYSSLVPGGSESSMLGIKTTFSKLLTWAPNLLFTFINESADDSPFSVAIVGPFFLIAAAIGWTINVTKAKEDIAHTLHLRRGKQWDAKSATVSPLAA